MWDNGNICRRPAGMKLSLRNGACLKFKKIARLCLRCDSYCTITERTIAAIVMYWNHWTAIDMGVK